MILNDSFTKEHVVIIIPLFPPGVLKTHTPIILKDSLKQHFYNHYEVMIHSASSLIIHDRKSRVTFIN